MGSQFKLINQNKGAGCKKNEHGFSQGTCVVRRHVAVMCRWLINYSHQLKMFHHCHGSEVVKYLSSRLMMTHL